MRIDLRRIESIKHQSAIVGNRVRAKVVKNKVAAPFRVAEFDIMFNEGISRVADLVDLGVTVRDPEKERVILLVGRYSAGAGSGELEGLSQGEQVYGFSPREPHPGGRGVTLAAGAGFEEWGGGGAFLGLPDKTFGYLYRTLSCSPESPSRFRLGSGQGIALSHQKTLA